jgi:predicted regulator of Ras-like GTPase activity (Roadblock/LC7/MglB family)
MCDLVPKSAPADLPKVSELASELASLASDLAGELNNGEPLTVQWKGGSGKKAAPKSGAADGPEEP